MSKIKLKFSNGIVPSERHVLKAFTKATSLKVTDLYCLSDCAFVTVKASENMQVLRHNNVKAKLNEANIKVILPHNYDSSNTLFANKIRPYLLDCTSQEIIKEVNDNNDIYDRKSIRNCK